MKNTNLKLSEENGFSMLEVIIGVTLFTIFFTILLFGFVSLVKMEMTSKTNIYNKLNNANEISNKYYIQEE